ncbi:hypothetical protein [Sphingopyxis sp.]|uniref:hypothetical protein n=1 Tax=Sphingopyxis sp. TaxID=1908224 RepID=UPI0025EF10DA|nr:hypothetical protein [Sphingopyxis sp.]
MAKVDSLEHPAAQDRHHALPGERLLADIVPLSLLPASSGGLVSTLIRRNTALA